MQVREEKTHTQPLLHYSYDMQNERPLHGGCMSDHFNLWFSSTFWPCIFSSQYCSYHGSSL